MEGVAASSACAVRPWAAEVADDGVDADITTQSSGGPKTDTDRGRNRDRQRPELNRTLYRKKGRQRKCVCVCVCEGERVCVSLCVFVSEKRENERKTNGVSSMSLPSPSLSLFSDVHIFSTHTYEIRLSVSFSYYYAKRWTSEIARNVPLSLSLPLSRCRRTHARSPSRFVVDPYSFRLLCGVVQSDTTALLLMHSASLFPTA